MSGFQVVEPSAGDTEWSAFSTIVNDTMQGFMALGLTNYDTTDVPLIAAGGKVEVAGSLYSFASPEAITGSLSTNQNYIMLTTSSSSITASYTSDPPTWILSKNGWYDSSTGVQRYIGGSATDFSEKWIYHEARNMRGLSGGLKDMILGGSGVKLGIFGKGTTADQVITGIGYKPSAFIFMGLDAGTTNMNWSLGFDNSVSHNVFYFYDNFTGSDNSQSDSIYVRRTSTNFWIADVTELSTDGFTMKFSLAGAAFNIEIMYIAFP